MMHGQKNIKSHQVMSKFAIYMRKESMFKVLENTLYVPLKRVIPV